MHQHSKENMLHIEVHLLNKEDLQCTLASRRELNSNIQNATCILRYAL